MELTKFGHACVRLEKDGRRLVIDPGGLTGAEALDGANAVLVTHEHFDHFAGDKLHAAVAADPDLEIWTNAATAGLLDGFGSRLHVVGDGDAFTAAGFEIQAHGTWHAEIHRDIPRITNVGFLIDGEVFHPGDALTVPAMAIDTLLLPVHAPWSRTADLIDWVREVAPRTAYAVHDGALNEWGLLLVGGLLGDRGPGITPTTYTRLEPGTKVTVG